MELWEKIIDTYPELNPETIFNKVGIFLQDDGDEIGAYIAKWEYSQPIPKGLKLGKPSA